MARPLCKPAPWWRRLGTLPVVVMGIVLSPLAALAATVPMVVAYDLKTGRTATTRIERTVAVGRGANNPWVIADDDAQFV